MEHELYSLDQVLNTSIRVSATHHNWDRLLHSLALNKEQCYSEQTVDDKLQLARSGIIGRKYDSICVSVQLDGAIID